MYFLIIYIYIYIYISLKMGSFDSFTLVLNTL
jgi:hypothetical protein